MKWCMIHQKKLENNKVMKIKLYQIDAFANKIFEGNPAAVCPLDEWLDDDLMQNLAMENNLAETAFFVKNADTYDLRWFTPTKEVNLCGHATLASAYVLFNFLGYEKEKIVFDTKSGQLSVEKLDSLMKMDFPVQIPVKCETPQLIVDAFNEIPLEVLKGEDYIVVYKDGTDLSKFTPNLEVLKKLDLRGVCITTRDKSYDFVSRFFAPNYGIDEDSVTGSAYTQLTPYWAGKLDKKRFYSKQLSPRGGELQCELNGNRVYIFGNAVCTIVGEILV